MPALLGKVALVTGANSGIGKAAATGLAREGAEVTLLVRNRERGEAAMRDIAAAVPGAKLELLVADLASQASVRAAAKEFLARHDALHVLVQAAGVFLAKREETEDGIERTFATNYLGHFLLTNLLLDALKKGAPSRVISVASRYSNGPWVSKIDFDDLMVSRRKFSVFTAVPPTKLAQVLFTQELSERMRGSGIHAHAVHPGLVARTQLLPQAPRFFRWMTDTFGGTPEQGADTVVWLAAAPEALQQDGKLWEKRKPLKTPGQGSDPAARKRLWDESLRLAKLA